MIVHDKCPICGSYMMPENGQKKFLVRFDVLYSEERETVIMNGKSKEDVLSRLTNKVGEEDASYATIEPFDVGKFLKGFQADF